MSYHIFTETNITPSTKVINLRSAFSDSAPHRTGFCVQTTVADGSAGVVTMRCRYEDQSHNEHNYELPGVTLTTTDIFGGGFHSQDVFDAFDKYFADLSGALGEPNGLFQLELDLGGPAGTSKITYFALVELLDGSPNIVYHP